MNMVYVKGQSGNPNGRPKGVLDKATGEFKEAVNNLINFATPKMVEWLEKVAEDDPAKALDHVYKFAQFGYPVLSRSVGTQDIKHEIVIRSAIKDLPNVSD